MKNFFNSDTYTEFFNPKTDEIWVFGDSIENITEETPHQFVGRDPHWGHGDEAQAELPITGGHGEREFVHGKVYEGKNYEILGTTAETKIKQFYIFNAE